MTTLLHAALVEYCRFLFRFVLDTMMASLGLATIRMDNGALRGESGRGGVFLNGVFPR